MTGSKYIGNELQIFSIALKWKQYWSSLILQDTTVKNSIEIGAGIGSNIPYLVGHSKKFYVLEPDTFFYENHLKPYSLRYNSITAINGTISNIVNKIKLEHIFYIDVLEHIENDKLELEQASKILSAQGSIFLLVPAHQFLFSYFDRSVGHFRRYTIRSLSKIIPSECQIVNAKYLDSLGFFLSTMIKISPKKISPTQRNIQIWDKYLVPLSKLIDKLLSYKVGKSLLVEIKLCNTR